MQRIILASQSPRKKQILEQLGLTFETIPSSYEEDMTLPLSPEELAKKMSLGKAQDVFAKNPDALIIANDIFIVYEGTLLGKPHTLERAREMLTMISGKTHQAVSGTTVMTKDKEVTEATVTNIVMRSFTTDEIERYLQKEDTLDAAAAYKIQGLGAALIEKIDGDYNNVVGLPVNTVTKLLREFRIMIP